MIHVFPELIVRQLRRVRRWIYGLRAYLPWTRDHHRMETMIGPVGYWDELQNYQLNVLTSRGAKPEHNLLDLACGPLQGGVAFIRYLNSANYIGVDINPDHLDAANLLIARNRLAGKNARLIVSATYGEELLNGTRFDYIWASQILYLFDEAKIAEVFAFIKRRLKPEGKFLGDIINPLHYEALLYPRCGFIRHEVDALTRIAEAQGLHLQLLGELKEFNYPKRLQLRSSLLLEFTHKV